RGRFWPGSGSVSKALLGSHPSPRRDRRGAGCAACSLGGKASRTDRGFPLVRFPELAPEVEARIPFALPVEPLGTHDDKEARAAPVAPVIDPLHAADQPALLATGFHEPLAFLVREQDKNALADALDLDPFVALIPVRLFVPP